MKSVKEIVKSALTMFRSKLLTSTIIDGDTTHALSIDGAYDIQRKTNALVPIKGANLSGILSKDNMVFVGFVTRLSVASGYVVIVHRQNGTIYSKDLYNSGAFNCLTNRYGTISLRYNGDMMGVYGYGLLLT